MDICKKLDFAKNDEADAILFYAKLKNLMPSEHIKHIETLEDIISDEYRHLLAILEMIKDMNCKGVTELNEEKMKELEAIAVTDIKK